MSFGRRSPNSNASPGKRVSATIDPAPGEHGASELATNSGMSPKLRAQLTRMAGLAAFFLFCIYGAPFLLINLPYVALRFAGSPPVHDHASADPRAPYMIEIYDASSPGSPTQMERDLGLSCLPAGVDAVRGLGLAALNFRQASSFLACAMSTYENRLCQPVERRRLAANLTRYAATWRRMTAVSRSDPSGAFANATFSLSGSGGDRGDVAAGSGGAFRLDQDVVAAVWKLSGQGYLSVQDFGRRADSMPPELGPYMQRPAVRSCP